MCDCVTCLFPVDGLLVRAQNLDSDDFSKVDNWTKPKR